MSVERTTEAESNQFIGWYDGYHGRDAEVTKLKAEIERLRVIAEAAGGLIEEIVEHGTHTRWKETANAISNANQQSEKKSS